MTESAPATPERDRTDLPRVYIASLSDYNHMVLHGVWIDNLSDLDHFREQIQAMLDASAEAVAEEHAVHDYEGFGDWPLSEHESIENISRVAQGIEEHGPAFAAWADYLGDVSDGRLDDFDDAYRGHWDNIEAFAEAMLDDYGFNPHDIGPDWLNSYIYVDLARLGRDLSSDLHVANDGSGRIWIFDPET